MTNRASLAAAAGRPPLADTLPGLLQARKDTCLLGRWAVVDEVARPILWLASDEGSYISGTMLDGGLHVM